MLGSRAFVAFRYGFFASTMYYFFLNMLDSLRGLVFRAVCYVQYLFGDRLSAWLLGLLYRKLNVLDTAEPLSSSSKYVALWSWRVRPDAVLASKIGVMLLKGCVLPMDAIRADMDKREASLLYALFKHNPEILKDLIFSYPRLFEDMLCDFRRGNNAFWCVKDARILSCLFCYYLTCSDLVDDLKKKNGFMRAWGRCVGLDTMLAQMSLVEAGVVGRLLALPYLKMRTKLSEVHDGWRLTFSREIKIYDLMSRIKDIDFWSMLCDMYPDIELSVMHDFREGSHNALDESLPVVFRLLIKRGNISYEDVKKDAAYGDRSYVVRVVRFDPAFLFKYSGYWILLARLSLNGRTDPCYIASRGALMGACEHSVIEDMGLYPNSVTYLLVSGFSKEDWRRTLVGFRAFAECLRDDFFRGSAAQWCYATQDVLAVLMELSCLSESDIQTDLERREHSCMAGWRRVFGPKAFYSLVHADHVYGRILKEVSSDQSFCSAMGLK